MYNIETDKLIREAAELMMFKDLTIRQIAQQLCISKTTVHKYLTVRLKEIDYNSYLWCRGVLDTHKKEAPHRGGEATSRKYKECRKVM